MYPVPLRTEGNDAVLLMAGRGLGNGSVRVGNVSCFIRATLFLCCIATEAVDSSVAATASITPAVELRPTLPVQNMCHRLSLLTRTHLSQQATEPIRTQTHTQ